VSVPAAAIRGVAAADRVAWLEKLAQELPASVAIIDDVYEERRIGEESSASVPMSLTVRRRFISPDGFYPLRRARPVMNSVLALMPTSSSIS
jgi:hypothetical protein